MKIKVAEWIADFLVENGITCNFTVPGGAAMHLNMALGHNEKITNMFMLHEQAAAIAAEAYARMNNNLALVCVTSGPGGTNALTGVLGGWLDSIPMLVISGQVRYKLMARSTGLELRSMGPQEFDITKAVKSMTKYAELVSRPEEVKYHLQKAIYLAKSGRPGPVWLDINLEVQSAYIDDSEMKEFVPEEEGYCNVKCTEEDVIQVIDMIKSSDRPVIIAGNGIRLAGGVKAFREVVRKLGIPVTSCWDSIDLIETSAPIYIGRGGTMGDRAGNWAVQNSDLVLSIGSRLNTYQVGYDRDAWAPNAKVIMVDIDEVELRKPTIHVDYPIHSDAKHFLERLAGAYTDARLPNRFIQWRKCCLEWKEHYPVVTEKQYEQEQKANVYCFINELSRRLGEDQVTVVGNGSASVVGSQAFIIKKGQRFIINNGCSTMGYDIPAAIGACKASRGRKIVCVTGDGSIQMNIQELQTIVTHGLPIIVYVINNEGYHQMRITENNMFPGERKVGVGSDSGDLMFPKMRDIAKAYGIKYYTIESNSDLGKIDIVQENEGAAICEVFVDTIQAFEPKSASRQLEDGTYVSSPLEDLAPFLPRAVLAEIMGVTSKWQG